jgi:hypothetical protein
MLGIGLEGGGHFIENTPLIIILYFFSAMNHKGDGRCKVGPGNQAMTILRYDIECVKSCAKYSLHFRSKHYFLY